MKHKIKIFFPIWQVHFNLKTKPEWVENKIHNHWTWERPKVLYMYGIWIEKSLPNSIKRKKVMG